MSDKSEKLVKALKDISRIINNFRCDCISREYTLDDDEMGWVFYCRDLADQVVREYENETKN